MTMTILNAEIAALIKREGGFTNDPVDKGGETNFGITKRVARQFGYEGPMEDMPLDTAVTIYKNKYFRAPNFDKVSNYSWAIALELFDTGVNMGQGTGAMFLQRALNALNNEGKAYPEVSLDGAIGQFTLDALQTYLLLRGKEGEQVLLRALNCLQGARYIEIAEKDKTQERFIFGWLRTRIS